MKYTEFEKRITERLGFEVENGVNQYLVKTHQTIVATVSKTHSYTFVVTSKSLLDDEARYLAQMCHELACTPLEAREDEKKYIYKFPFPHHRCLGRVAKLMKKGDDGIALDDSSDSFVNAHDCYHFTNKEVEDLCCGNPQMDKLFKLCAKEEVGL